MKRKIFVFFACMLMCIQLFITPAHADEVITDWYTSYNYLVNINDFDSVYYFGGALNTSLIDSNFSKKKIIYGYSYEKNYVFRIFLTNDIELSYDSSDSKLICTQGSFFKTQQNISNGLYWEFGGSCDNSLNTESVFSFDVYEIIYSSVDIVDENGDLHYSSDDIDAYATNDNWFSLTVNPQPEENWDLSFSYTKPDGTTVTDSELKISLTVKQVERQYKVSNTDIANKEKQCFVFISTEPCVNGDYSLALDSCVYLHAYETSYYTDVVLNMDRWIGSDNSYIIDANTSYGANVGIDLNEKLDFAGIPHSKTIVSEYVQNFGYTTLARLNFDNDAQFTIDLNNVDLVEGQTYYFNCVAFSTPLSLARGISFWPVEKFGVQMFDETNILNFSPSLWGVNGSTDAQKSAAYGVSSAPFSFADGSLKSLGHKYDKLDCGFDNSTYSDSNLTAGTPQSSIHTGVNIDGSTYYSGMSNPSDSFNSSDGFSIVKFASQFVPFLSASLSILPEPIGGILQFSVIAVLACCLVTVVFRLLSKLIG